jgi:hypothetical protein
MIKDPKFYDFNYVEGFEVEASKTAAKWNAQRLIQMPMGSV